MYSKKKQQYLLVWVGMDECGKKIMEYAHRLVCLAFHGGPRLKTAEPGSPFDWRLVVNHKCKNPCCLNPDHLEWLTAKQNMDYEGFEVGHTKPKVHIRA